jgi:hypothetical protein
MPVGELFPGDNAVDPVVVIVRHECVELDRRAQ